MTKHPLTSLLAEHLNHIDQRSSHLKKIINREDIHDLRVEIKRMRAILRLLYFFQPNWPYRKSYAPFRNLFQSAGILRELQLQNLMLNHIPDVSSCFQSIYRGRTLEKQIAAWTHLFGLLQYAKLPSGKRLIEAADQVFQCCKDSDFDRYFATKAKEVHNYLIGGLESPTENLHSLRKALKDYNNNRLNLHLVLQYDPGVLPGLPKDTFKIDHILGDWNDYQTALMHLDQDKVEKWAKPFVAEFDALRIYWHNCAEALLRQLYEQFQKKSTKDKIIHLYSS